MADSKGKISCEICGSHVHVIRTHLKSDHPDMTIETYKETYPDSPTLSLLAKQHIAAKKKELERKVEEPTIDAPIAPIAPSETIGYDGVTKYQTEKVALHELLQMPPSALLGAAKKPLVCTAFVNTPFPEFIPDIHSDYVFDPEHVKDCGMALEDNLAAYFYGFAGTGKSSMPTELAARLNRPIIRAQHTANTEESEIIGQILANEKGTYFEPGLLAIAARHGMIYLADEYDMAYAQVLATYQAVLERQPLVIKNATPEWKKTKLHEYFAFIGTGNTNGSGDETGLYIGTQTQNTANYSRFAISEEFKYLSKKAEVAIILSHINITEEYASLLVDFAHRIRTAFGENDMPMTIGPRELIHAAKVGAMRADFKIGLRKAWINRLPSTYRDAAEELLQRIFS